MANRKAAMKEGLKPKPSPQVAPGWKDQVASQPVEVEEQEPVLKRKTYLVSETLIQRIADKAKAENVGINELVRFLLANGLERLDKGELELPLEPVYRLKT